MLELKTMNAKAHEWLNKSRAKSDLLLNNICVVFNGKIVGGRDKPVITLLEYIKEYCMKRIVNIQGGVIDKCIGPLTPTATRIMESIKKEAHLMKYMEGNILSQDTTNLWDQVLGEVHMSNNTFATQASCPGKEELLHVNHAKTLDTIRQQAKDKVATMQKPMVDGSFHSPEWHAARLASLKTSHTVTWEEYKKKQKEDELKKGELEADKDRMMREYRAQLDAERATKLAHGRNHSKSTPKSSSSRKDKDLKKHRSNKKRKILKRTSDHGLIPDYLSILRFLVLGGTNDPGRVFV
ncbi:hypothetical protein Tco_0005059 [Tanacetum coccineum]